MVIFNNWYNDNFAISTILSYLFGILCQIPKVVTTNWAINFASFISCSDILFDQVCQNSLRVCFISLISSLSSKIIS